MCPGPAPAESRGSLQMSGVGGKKKASQSWLSAGSRLLYSFTSVLIYPKTNNLFFSIYFYSWRLITLQSNNLLKRFKEGGMIRLYQVHNHGLHHK